MTQISFLRPNQYQNSRISYKKYIYSNYQYYTTTYDYLKTSLKPGDMSKEGLPLRLVFRARKGW